MSQTKTACPEAELLGAFIEGTLRGDEQAVVLSHLAACRACLDVFAAAAELERDVSPGLPGAVLSPGALPKASADAPGGLPAPDRVLPFKPRRRLRLAAVVLPLAAAAALVVLVKLPPPPSAPSGSPQTAQGPSPAPSALPPVSAPPRPAVDRINLAKLPRNVFPELDLPLGFDGPPHGQRRCLMLGAETVAIEVVARSDGAQAEDRLLRLRARLRVARATPLRALREASGCDDDHADAYAGAYAVALLRLAAHTRDADLLAHPEVEDGLKRASRAGLAGLPHVLRRLADVPDDWESLREACDALLGEWR